PADRDLHAGGIEDVVAHETDFLSSQRKIGTPIKTMKGPTGSSIGARTVRAKVSPPARSAAPAKAETGTTKTWLEDPPAMRTTWGTTRPRKPSKPAIAAEAAASSAAPRPAARRITRGRAPSEAATSSPSARRSSGRT